MNASYHRGCADLLLTNARVVTLQPERPAAEFVAIKAAKILGVGPVQDASLFKGPATREIDCQGMVLLPGFNDAHCHLMAFASSLRGVDCRPDVVRTISEIVRTLGRRAEGTPTGEWIRGFGYDEYYLTEGRHPSRWDLDRTAPYHPVRLDHRTGHASVLNSRGLEALSISRLTPDPVDGVIDRDDATGEPTGVLFEMAEYINRRTKTKRRDDEFLEGISRADNLLLSRGITSVQDASPGNDLRRWETFRRLKAEGRLTPRVVVMPGESHLSSFLDAGLSPGSGDDSLKLGAVKVMTGLATGTLQPYREHLADIAQRAHERGFQLAFHAVEQEAVEAVVDVLIEAQKKLPRPDARHRIEHCSECPPLLARKLVEARTLVVSQPSFIYHNGERYLSLVAESLLPHLYPLGSLARSGTVVAAGSDAPVTEPDPLLGIYAAVSRLTRGGGAFFPSQSISAQEALEMHTINAAYACFDETRRGSIEVGKLADLVLLDADPRELESEALREISVMMTIVDGRVVWAP